MPAALALPGLGLGQAAAPAASAASGAASSAMQRAQRAAESPLRAIIEAAKVRRRIEPEGVDAEGATAAASRRIPPRAPAAVAGELATRSIATAPVAPLAVVPAQIAPQAATPRASLAADTGITAIRTLPGELARPAKDAVAPPAGLSAVGRLQTPPAQPELPRVQAMPAPQPSAITAPAAATVSARPSVAASATPTMSGPSVASADNPPRLLHMVEPEVSARVLETLTRREVSVEFTIGTDGAVSEIKVSLPAPRPLVASITAALEQWRFEAQRAPRAHKVLLVFSPDR